MSRFYLRRDPGPRENLGAAAVALGVGTVVFVCVRLFLAREAFDREAPKRLPKGEVDVAPAPDSGG